MVLAIIGKDDAQERRNNPARDAVNFILAKLARPHAGEHSVVICIRHAFTPFPY
jgi:hypothetical protein